MITINRVGTEPLNPAEKESLIVWKDKYFVEGNRGSYKALFSDSFCWITIKLFTIWIMINSMYFGQLIILPFIFGKVNLSFSSYFITVLGEA
jgi:hypothetical protein